MNCVPDDTAVGTAVSGHRRPIDPDDPFGVAALDVRQDLAGEPGSSECIPQYAKVSTLDPSALSCPSLRPDLDRFPLPGSGDRYERCGWVLRVGACKDLHKKSRHVTHEWCRRPECPTCYGAWAARGATRANQRLWAGYRLDRKNGGSPGYVKKWVFSTDDNPNAEDWDHVKERQRFYRILEKAGVKASVVIPHGYRVTDEGKAAFKNYKQQNGELGRWAWIIKNHYWDYTYWSPHWHVIGWGWLQQSDEFHKETGWIYKNIGLCKDFVDNDGKRHEKEGTSYAYIFYTLTHSLLVSTDKSRRQAYTYTGKLSYRVLGSKKETDKVIAYCPKCKYEIYHCFHSIEDQETVDWSLVDIDYDTYWTERRTITTFYLKKFPTVQDTVESYRNKGPPKGD